MRRAVVSLLAVAAAVGTARAQPDPVPQPPAPSTGTTTPAPPPDPSQQPAEPPPAANEPQSTAPTPPVVSTAPPAGHEPVKLTKDQIEAIRAACQRQDPSCDPVALLGTDEQVELARILTETHLVLDRAPWGKRLGRIIVNPIDVFVASDYPLTLLNIFHRTTRTWALEREVILRPGDVWKQSAVDETIRKFHDPNELVIALAVPVASPEPGKVDLLVVTRDVWSIRLNSNYEVQSSKLTYLTLSLSENNLLGMRKILAAVFTMDQGAYEVGPEYIDRFLLGTKLQLIAQGGVIFGRDRSDYEGSSSDLELSYPLWSLDSHWSAGVVWNHTFNVVRSFLGTSLRTYDDPSTATVEALPWEYKQKMYSLTSSVTRQWPGWLEQQLKFGHILALERPTIYDPSLFASEAVEQDFIRDVLPRSELSSQLFVSYSIFRPRYRAFHNIETFAVAEDQQLGPSATVTVGAAFHQIGSENNFAPITTAAGWTEAYGGDGMWHVDIASQHRIDTGGVIDDYFALTARLVTPEFSIGRVVFAGDAETRWHETQNRFLTAGGDSGLRGFIIGEFMGERRAVGHAEFRSIGKKLWFMRAGVVAFDDVGGAAETFSHMPVYDDLGVGLRLVVPQTSPFPLRFDWAFAVNGPNPGWPGRVILGYQQGF